jgi:hypothetical protein
MFPNCRQATPQSKELLKAVEDVCKAELVAYFMDSIECYFSGNWPERYLEIVENPICFGDIISACVESVYDTAEQCMDDMRLLADNCEKYSTTKYAEKGESVPDIDLVMSHFLYNIFILHT